MNPLHSPWHRADLELAMRLGVTRIHLPKLSSAADLLETDHRLLELAGRWGVGLDRLRLYATIETPRGVIEAPAILASSPRIAGALLGADDLTAALGSSRSAEGREIEQARHWVVLAATAAGVLPLDATYPFHQDLPGCERDARLARSLGFRGKQAVHPAQCPLLNAAFTPTEAELARARAIVEAAEAARGRDRGRGEDPGRRRRGEGGPPAPRARPGPGGPAGAGVRT